MLAEIRIDCQPVLRCAGPQGEEITVLLRDEVFGEPDINPLHGERARYGGNYCYEVLIERWSETRSEFEGVYISIISSNGGFHRRNRLRPNGKAAMLEAARRALEQLASREPAG